MTTARPTTSSVRRRTRQAIVEAAITTWVRNRDATLDDIARSAETHRATVHRLFSSRAELLDAVIAQCVADMAAAETAAVIRGRPPEALRRVVAGYLAIGERIRFIFEDPAVARHPTVIELTATEGPVFALIRQGQADGSIDGRLSAAWVERSIWALVYAASEAIADGTLPAHEALPALLHTIERGVSTTR